MKYSPLAFAAVLTLAAPAIRADDAAAPAAAPSTVPDAGFPATRYEALWSKSPFSVATSETAGEASPDFYLVGIANVDGVSYASVIQRQNQEHFLISTDKPSRGLTLKSIKRSSDGTDTFAEVMKDGQPLTLKLEQAPAVAAAPGAPAVYPVTMPGGTTPQIPMPGAASSFPNNGSVRPFTRFHRGTIHLPPIQTPPPGGAAPAPTAAPGTTQPAPTPPPPPPATP